MGERTLNQRILDVLSVAMRPFSAADIRRRLHGDVLPDEVGSRLAKMQKQRKVVSVYMDSQACTGPRKIKGWVSLDNPIALEHVPSIAISQQNSEIASRQVASVVNVT